MILAPETAGHGDCPVCGGSGRVLAAPVWKDKAAWIAASEIPCPMTVVAVH